MKKVLITLCLLMMLLISCECKIEKDTRYSKNNQIQQFIDNTNIGDNFSDFVSKLMTGYQISIDLKEKTTEYDNYKIHLTTLIDNDEWPYKNQYYYVKVKSNKILTIYKSTLQEDNNGTAK